MLSHWADARRAICSSSLDSILQLYDSCEKHWSKREPKKNENNSDCTLCLCVRCRHIFSIVRTHDDLFAFQAFFCFSYSKWYVLLQNLYFLYCSDLFYYILCVCHLLLFVFYSSALTQTGFSELWWMVIGFYQLKISIASHSFYSDPDPIQYSLVCRRSCGQYCECLGDRGGGTQYTCYPRSVNKRIIPIGNNRLCCPWYIE